MYWRARKKIQVEVINPRLVLESPPIHAGKAPDTPVEAGVHQLSLDVSLKLAAVVAAVINACLLIFGYMRYLAMLELFGIERSEVVFSVADLLAYGYGAMINMVFASRVAQIVFGGSAGTIAITAVLLLWKKGAAWKQMLVSWLIGIVIAFLPTLPMFVGYYPARHALLAVAAEHLGVEPDKLDAVKKRTEVSTSDGWMQGDVLLTTGEFTYLLSDSVVYKVRQTDGKVIRRTHLLAKLKEFPEPND
ncbi:hypothetical protein J2T41_000597 [Pseudomonas citronellolis]|uniref:hypothetical protein n=1 Tax=Pseudomonas citronellolis TaxID=53408 RepID=UPI00209E6DE4|nr:hypothetical protein [Pseudomonas citronellolis]MCP1641003.1 hypothetical protein [Pseudomonas citronellolis]MCP1663921.1 hypothetical protein [Pseudomonas citronellolis]MCP1697099.1 hypothetical protein [Pseudomonas citronellolis]MCP1701267.1 hypothetical protein [Pseudomonas citronellolis]MCP1795708.1 hypothetical protein [Pseudomonas citronellolis]